MIYWHINFDNLFHNHMWHWHFIIFFNFNWKVEMVDKTNLLEKSVIFKPFLKCLGLLELVFVFVNVALTSWSIIVGLHCSCAVQFVLLLCLETLIFGLMCWTLIIIDVVEVVVVESRIHLGTFLFQRLLYLVCG